MHVYVYECNQNLWAGRASYCAQAWESDLKCHDLYGQGNDTDLEPDTRKSKLSTLCAPRDWIRMWLGACDKRLRDGMRHNLQAASHAAGNTSPADPALWQDEQQDEARRRASSQVVSGMDVLLPRTARAFHR